MEKPKMERTKTMTMNWDGLGEWDDDDDDEFFESNDRLSIAMPLDLASSGSDDDDEDFEDSRVSFASTVSSVYGGKSKRFGNGGFSPTQTTTRTSPDYNIWMESPGSITERRQRLFQGMGLSSGKKIISFKRNNSNKNVPNAKVQKSPPQVPVAVRKDVQTPQNEESKKDGSESDLRNSSLPVLFVRSRSDGEIDSLPIEKKRKNELLGFISKQRLTRTYSVMSTQHPKWYPHPSSFSPHKKSVGKGKNFTPLLSSKQRYGAFFLIKNLDSGKEFIVNENDEDGMWNKVSDLQTGKLLTMEEFEKSVGHSPVVRELMRRESVKSHSDRKINSYLTKSLKKSKRRGAAMLKTIKGVAHSMSMKGEKEKEKEKDKEKEKEKDKEKEKEKEREKETPAVAMDQRKNTKKNNWVKVRETGKSYKELSALHLCQEILAHEGSIWTIKFSVDAKFLASAGEDRIIHVWEVQECEVLPSTDVCATPMNPSLASNSPLHPSPVPSHDQSGSSDAAANPNDKKKKGKATKKANQIPDYVHVPETVFSLSDKPICSFKGHLDDILDLSWSRNQYLLSSSMDKTVRLWHLQSKNCLKLFAHNDYVTCIQFNPMDENYFISGSLDAKVRIWSIPNRHVVDWVEQHEMVTAACYTPDGQGAFIGCHKGSCRTYTTEDCKLEQLDQITILNKKKVNKITGFQVCPTNPTEILVTSADSRVRILDGTDVVYKFRGLRNTSSQIAASYTQDGKYVISASEDSQVYVWRCEAGTAGKRTVTNSRGYEHFTCKDVSVAIPWPGTVKGEPPSMSLGNSKRHNKKSPAKQTNPNPESPTTKEDSPQANHKKWLLPPIPKLKNHHHHYHHHHHDKAGTAPEEEHSRESQTESSTGGEASSLSNSRSIKKGDNSPSISSTSDCDSLRHGDSPSISSTGQTLGASSGHTTWSLLDVVGHGNFPTQPTAWGLVIVTATLGGEIRVYQNFGLPCRQGALTHAVKLN